MLPSVWGLPLEVMSNSRHNPRSELLLSESRTGFQRTEGSPLFFGKLHIPASDAEQPDVWMLEGST